MKAAWHYVIPVALAGFLPWGVGGGTLRCAADDVRIVEENGVRIQETTTVTRKPVSEVRVEKQAITTYRPEYVTRLRQQPQVVQVPVPSQQVVTQHFWWNPLKWGRPEQRVEATTVLQPRVQYVRIPTTTQVWIPETKTVDVATRYLRMEEDRQVSRLVLGPSNGVSSGASQVATRPTDSSGIVRPSGSGLRDELMKLPAPPVDLSPSAWR